MSAATTTVGSGFDPYGGLTPGRIDQGVDFGGAGPVKAVLPGVVKSVGLWHGWPGTGGVVYTTAQGNVFVMEDFTATVKPGQRVQAGDVIGRATGGSSGIETGWADSTGLRPLTPYNGSPDGTPMPGGRAFRQFLDGLHTGGAVPANAIVDGVKGAVTGVTDAVTGTIDAGKAAADLAGTVGDFLKDPRKALLYLLLLAAGGALAVTGLIYTLGSSPNQLARQGAKAAVI